MKQSERSLQFERHCVEHLKAGMNVREMAVKYGLSESHCYKLIHKLEDKMGLTKNSLLHHPHAEHVVLERKELKKVHPIDFSAFQEEFRNTISSMDKSLGLMDKTLNDWPEIPSLTPEREEICV